MLNEKSIVTSARTESTEGKTLKQTPAYRTPEVLEVGKASELLQGYHAALFRDAIYGAYNGYA